MAPTAVARSRPATTPVVRVAAKLQPRLYVGAVDDPAEREAERIADSFGGRPPHRTGSVSAAVGPDGGGITANLESTVERLRGSGGRPLDEHARQPLEQFFHRDLSDVRIHDSGAAATVSRSMGAVAFTSARDIFFDADQYRPGRADGMHLLAHEVTHVIQQGGGRIARSTARIDEPEPEAEAEAEAEAQAGMAVDVAGAAVAPVGRRSRIRRSTGLAMTVRHASPTTVIRRNAATWDTWATTALPGETHTFADANGMIAIDAALDATEAFLTDVQTRDEPKLKQMVQTAHALAQAGFDPAMLSSTAKKLLTDFQKSGNERMRFRAALGPTPGNVSLVEKFVTAVVTPVWGADPLPAWITTMTPVTRARMFELAKGSAAVPDKIAGLKWAKSQGVGSVSELVNYTEYHVARKDEVAARSGSDADEAFKKLKGSGAIEVVQPDDLRVVAEAKNLASVTEKNEIMKKAGALMSRATKSALTDSDVAAMALVGVTVAKTANRDGLAAAVQAGAHAKVEVAGYDLSKYVPIALAAVQSGIDTPELDALMTTAVAKVGGQVGGELRTQVTAVDSAGYTGPGPVVAGWATLPDTETARGAAISALAKSNKIPFFSGSGAAYHALKHYGDLVGTVEEAPTTPESMQTYLRSSTLTIAEPTEAVTRQFGQLYDTPSYFFVRTVSGKVGGAARKMRAIVSVNATGRVNIATYFQAT